MAAKDLTETKSRKKETKNESRPFHNFKHAVTFLSHPQFSDYSSGSRPALFDSSMQQMSFMSKIGVLLLPLAGRARGSTIGGRRERETKLPLANFSKGHSYRNQGHGWRECVALRRRQHLLEGHSGYVFKPHSRRCLIMALLGLRYYRSSTKVSTTSTNERVTSEKETRSRIMTLSQSTIFCFPLFVGEGIRCTCPSWSGRAMSSPLLGLVPDLPTIETAQSRMR